VGHPTKESQTKRETLVSGKMLYGFLQLPALISVYDTGLNTFPIVALVITTIIPGDRISFRPDGGPTVKINGPVPGDTGDPGDQFALVGIIRMRFMPDLDKDVLGDLLGCFLAPQYFDRHTEYQPAITVVKAAQGIGIFADDALDQEDIRIIGIDHILHYMIKTGQLMACFGSD
jgi:hypothetical protein